MTLETLYQMIITDAVDSDSGLRDLLPTNVASWNAARVCPEGGTREQFGLEAFQPDDGELNLLITPAFGDNSDAMPTPSRYALALMNDDGDLRHVTRDGTHFEVAYEA